MVYSMKKRIDDGLKLCLRQAITLAKKQDPPDREYQMRHPDEVKDAANKNFEKLKARVTKEYNDNVQKNLKWRESHWKKN